MSLAGAGWAGTGRRPAQPGKDKEANRRKARSAQGQASPSARGHGGRGRKSLRILLPPAPCPQAQQGVVIGG